MSGTSSKNSKGKNTVIVASCTLLSRALGVVKARALASAFGLGPVSDAINFSFNLPNNLRKLFAEGSMSQAFVPLYENAEESEKSQLIGALMLFQSILMLSLVVLSYLLRYPIIKLFSGFTDDMQIQVSGGLLAPFMVFLWLISLSATMQAALQCRRMFLIQALAPILFSLSVIFSVVFLSQKWGPWSMAFGVCLGALLQTIVLMAKTKASGIKIRLSLDFFHGPFSKVLKAWSLASVSCLLAIIGQQASFSIATSMDSGTVTAFSNSLIFWQTPYGIFFTSVATVYFPELSNRSSHIRKDNFSEALERLYSYLLPSAIILFALRRETVSTILQSGSFTLEACNLTSQALAWFLAGMVFVAFNNLCHRLCFATRNYKASLVFTALGVALDVGLTILFSKLGLKIISFPIANSISALACVVLQYFFTVKRILKDFSLREFARTLVRPTIANLILLVFAIIYSKIGFNWYIQGSTWMNLVRLCLSLGSFGIILLGLYKIFKVQLLLS